MSTIYLVRHAHAKSSGPTDADRPLSDTGRREARRLGAFLAAADERPDQFVCSTAVRARQTAEEVADGGEWKDQVPLRSARALYEADPADVLDAIRAVDASLGAVMLIGHDPSWSAAVGRLIGSAQVTLPPGTGVRIDSSKAWNDVVFGAGVLRWMVPPTLIRQ